jgi:hypothetical protein
VGVHEWAFHLACTFALISEISTGSNSKRTRGWQRLLAGGVGDNERNRVHARLERGTRHRIAKKCRESSCRLEIHGRFQGAVHIEWH